MRAIEQQPFVDLETRPLSIADHNFDILIVGGNDPVRAKLSHNSDEMSYNYLKVLASNLRAKLKAPYVLIPGGRGSYKITALAKSK